jgi:hypothetical protein
MSTPRALLEPTAHELTLLFHRFLTEREWREVVDAVRRSVPYVAELRADAVHESPELLERALAVTKGDT